MNNVIAFPVRPPCLSSVRNRDEVLQQLVPQIIGLVWDRGGSDPFEVYGNATVRLDEEIVVGGFMISPGEFGVHVYTPDLKVFSATLVDRAIVPGYRPYFQGRCAILSWRRGIWEDRVMAERIAPRTVAHVLTAGLTRGRR